MPLRLQLGHPGWRSPSGAIEDRNIQLWREEHAVSRWRSPSGAIEDRNV
ncbi:hypothetical protein ACFWC9_31825 [Streptomyces goshikiensis]